MARRKKIEKKEPKYHVFSISTHVLTLEVFKYGEKTKTVFDCESPTGKPRKCVYWQDCINPTTVQVGDEVIITGRIENGVFLVYKLLYNPRVREQKELRSQEHERTG